MKPAHTSFAFLEALELRIAPASLAGIDYKAITLGSPQLLKAGEGLSTSEDGTGSLLLAVEKGQMLVFTTDLNGNGRFDPNEITGIAAGDGLRFTAFVDINGDIVTNLQADGKLTDSDGDPSNGRDGQVCSIPGSRTSPSARSRPRICRQGFPCRTASRSAPTHSRFHLCRQWHRRRGKRGEPRGRSHGDHHRYLGRGRPDCEVQRGQRGPSDRRCPAEHRRHQGRHGGKRCHIFVRLSDHRP